MSEYGRGVSPEVRRVRDIVVEQGWEQLGHPCDECDKPNQDRKFWINRSCPTSTTSIVLCDHCLTVRIRAEVADAARVTAEQKAPEDLTWGDAMHLTPKYALDIASLGARVGTLETGNIGQGVRIEAELKELKSDLKRMSEEQDERTIHIWSAMSEKHADSDVGTGQRFVRSGEIVGLDKRVARLERYTKQIDKDLAAMIGGG